jgi:PAS domain S-box-containing protein
MSTVKAPIAPAVPPPANWLDHERKGHTVEFYTEDSALIEGLSRFIGAALWAGDGAIVVASEPHRESLARALSARGLDTAEARLQGRYVVLDAAETLSKITKDGFPDEALFNAVIGSAIERVRWRATDKHVPIAAFGEMVALLWAEGKARAAIRLEELWNDLARAHSFALRCAYPMAGFDRERDGELYLKICAEHSAVIPSNDRAGLPVEGGHLRSIADLQQKVQALESEAALRQSEERFRLLVEGVQDYAIFMLDADGCVESWNIGAERIKGYKAAEIMGKHFSCFYPEEEVRSHKPQQDLDIAAREGRFEDEGWRIRKDGKRFFANLLITALRDSSGRLRGFSKVTRDITEKMRVNETLKQGNEELRKEIAERIAAQRKLHESEQSLRKLSGHLLRMQDEERRRLGRELHDSVGQYLAALKMGLDSLGGDEVGQLSECIRLVDQSMSEVRTISYLLYPPMLEEMGLKSAIPWYLDGFAKRSGIRVAWEIPADFERLSRDVELAIFRVLQESLTNVHRHSGSETAEVRLQVESGTACLEVTDHGVGIPADVLELSAGEIGTLGVGLRGMAERMRQLGGDVSLSSTPEGTTVRATAPAQQ